MLAPNPLHPDFLHFLKEKEQPLIDLFIKLRDLVWQHYPEANEILYHTHALTTVFSISEKLADAFCHISIYTAHLNLGFNKGTLLPDPHQLLQGTGKLIRHIPINQISDPQKESIGQLIQDAIALSLEDRDHPTRIKGKSISKIKRENT